MCCMTVGDVLAKKHQLVYGQHQKFIFAEFFSAQILLQLCIPAFVYLFVNVIIY